VKNKVLLIGPMPKPINGVSICNELITNKSTSFKVNYIDTANKSFNEKAGSFSFQKVFSSLKPYFKILKILKSDIVYMTIGQTFYGVLKYYPFFLLSKIFRKEIVIHIHGNFLGKQYKELSGFKKNIFKYILKKSDKGIVLSESLKPNLTPFLSEKKIHILYNFVEKQLVNISINEVKSKNTSQLEIVYLSNLMTEKGIFNLLHALKILNKNKINFTANIAGNIDNTIKDEVIQLIESIDGAHYVGVVRGNEKRKLFLNANTFVFPTYYKMEGQPIAILEAMAAGNIILTTKHAGIPDIFSEKNGFYIEKKSPKDIAEKLSSLSSKLDSFKPMMFKNQLYVKENYTEPIFLSNLAAIFKQ